MKLPVDAARPRLSRAALILSLPVALAACSLLGAGGEALASTPSDAPGGRGTGPEADYPLVTGEPYSVAGTQYKPEDVMNYDAVGYLAADSAGDSAISGSHHTLPLPSYVEVTSLDTGRTILVRLERRGPMNSNELLALSPGALGQLGATAGTPVRVRRVNPPEEQRTVLRQGQSVALRMDTPMSLVAVLKRKLPGAPVAAASSLPPVATFPVTPAPIQAAVPASPPVAMPTMPAAQPTPLAQATPVAARPSPQPTPRPAATAAASTGTGLVVQAAAFSSEANARKAAKALGGAVSRTGNLWRVRTGPFPTRSAAEASLAKVRAAGYSDARIFTSG